MKNALILCDLDGTLFDTAEVNFYAYKEAMEELDYHLEHDYYVNQCNGRHYATFLPKIVPSQEHIKQIHKRKKECYSNYLSTAKMNKHLFSLLEQMKETAILAVVTTASRQNCMDILGYFGKEDLFDLILTQEDITSPKPDPGGFLKAMKHFEMTAEQTIIYEDSDVGLQAAVATGATVFKIQQF